MVIQTRHNKLIIALRTAVGIRSMNIRKILIIAIADNIVLYAQHGRLVTVLSYNFK
jgi:hypothetical protein